MLSLRCFRILGLPRGLLSGNAQLLATSKGWLSTVPPKGSFAAPPVAGTNGFPASTAFQNETPSSSVTSESQDTPAFPGESLETDFSTSYKGISIEPFPQRTLDVLSAPVEPSDIEMKPDGLIYLPEIKYRRILNKAFGPGGWGLVPRGPHTVNAKNISREYALFCLGRFVSQARGEQDYFGQDSLPTASEGCKSNALMRCCKDLGIASELWDPIFIKRFKAAHCTMVQALHTPSKSKKWIWKRKDRTLDYPYKEEK